MRSISLFIFIICQCLFCQLVKGNEEQLLLLPTQSSYENGEIIQVNGLVIGKASTMSENKIFIVELVGPLDSVYLRKQIRCPQNKPFTIELETESYWPNATYILRGYNYYADSLQLQLIPKSLLRLGQVNTDYKNNSKTDIPKGNDEESYHHEKTGVKVTFFPEGGNLINGARQRLVFLVNDISGTPIETSFEILKNGKLHLSGKTGTNGIGEVYLLCDSIDTLQLECMYKGASLKIDFPKRNSTQTLQCILARNKITWQILSSSSSIEKRHLFILSPSFDLKKIGLISTSTSGVIHLDENESGVYSLFLTNENYEVLAHRNLWNSSPYVPLSLVRNDFNRNEVIPITDLFIPNNSGINFRIVDSNEYPLSGKYLSQIGNRVISEVYFNQMLYFENSREMDKWMLTSRSTLIPFFHPNKFNSTVNFSMKQLTLKGIVTHKNGNPLCKGTILAYNIKTNEIFTGEVNEKGEYDIPVTDFVEETRFYLQAHPTKGPPDIYNYYPHVDIFPTFPNIYDSLIIQAAHSSIREVILDQSTKSDIMKEVFLSEIEIKAKKRNIPTLSRKEFYKLNFMDAKLISERNITRLEDVFQALPGIRINIEEVYDSDKKQYVKTAYISSTRGSSTLKGSAIPIICDGMKIDFNELNVLLNASEIETVELLRPAEAIAYAANAIDGAIIIKTRKVYKNETSFSKGYAYFPFGLTKTHIPSDTVSIPSNPGEYTVLAEQIDENQNLQTYWFKILVR